MKRHSDALAIQEGACNPLAIANAIAKGCRETWDNGEDATKDPAIRLMVHQLAFICGLGDHMHSVEYSELCEECYLAIGKTKEGFDRI